MKMRTIRFILIAAAAVLAVSCAEERSESAESVQDRILKAYVEKYYPDAVRSESGLYFLEQSEGTGRTPEDTSYVLVEYSITYLDGTYSAYTSETIAQQLGTYTHSGYYDPRIWSLRDNTPGIVEILTGMQEGGSVKAIIPAILLDQESGLEITQGDGSSLIYDIHLLQVIDNIDEYEIGEVESYLQTNFPGIQDSTDYGFYFPSWTGAIAPTLSRTKTIQVTCISDDTSTAPYSTPTSRTPPASTESTTATQVPTPQARSNSMTRRAMQWKTTLWSRDSPRPCGAWVSVTGLSSYSYPNSVTEMPAAARFPDSYL